MARKARQAAEAATDERDDKAAPGEAKSDEDLHKRALSRFKELSDYWERNRKLALEDIKFRAGDQWPEQEKERRSKDMRPALVFNQQEQYIRQIVNDGRQNRPSVKYRPVDDAADVKTAEVFAGLTRHILANSNADDAFDTALDHSVGNGFGYFRVVTDYMSDRSFEQDLFVRRIRNPLAVLLAPHQAADASDAEDGFVIDEMGKEAFKRAYPQAKAVDWKRDSDKYETGWMSELTVRVAEYFYKVATPSELYQLEDGTSIEAEDHARLLANGAQDVPQIVNRRKIIDLRVHWCRMSGAEVLEKNTFPSRYIPIVPVYGTEMDVDGKVTYSGLVRPAMDPLRLYNYERTAYCERVALAPKSPWVVAAGQVEGHPEWETANTGNHPYLPYDPVDVNGTMAPPPRRTEGADIPAGFAQGLEITAHDIQSAIGMFASSIGDKSNEKSGRAIIARQREGDVGSFHYHDNLNRAIRHLGRILLDAAPKVYDSKRVARILGEDGSEERIVLDPSQRAGQGFVPGKTKLNGMLVYNLAAGRYDVDVSAGPSYSTKRQEAADAMLETARNDPAVWQTHGDLIVKSQDWPMADEFAERFKAVMPQPLKDAIAQAEAAKDGDEVPPEVLALQEQMRQLGEQAQQQVEEMAQALREAQERAAEAEMGKREAEHAARTKEMDEEIERKRLNIEAYKAKTERLQVKAAAKVPKASTPYPPEPIPGLDGGAAATVAAVEDEFGNLLPVPESGTIVPESGMIAPDDGMEGAADELVEPGLEQDIDPAVQTLVQAMGENTAALVQALVQAVTAPRENIPQRDPATGQIIGAVSRVVNTDAPLQ